MDRSDFEGLAALAKQILGKSENAFINPPFYCDYGKNIEIGKNFFGNYNLTILDVGKVRIGDNCQCAPNVAIYTAGHPVHPATRNTLYEYGIDVTIPAWSVAAGNPCKVIRKITEADRYTYYKGVPADEEAVADMQRMWAENTDPVKYPTADE